MNQFFKQQKLREQTTLLLPKEDTNADISELNEALIKDLEQLEPFGSGNPQPIFKSVNLLVMNQRKMGDSSQHVKLTFQTEKGATIDMLAFNAPDHFFVEPGKKAIVWYTVDVNEWQGRRNVEGFIRHLEIDNL